MALTPVNLPDNHEETIERKKKKFTTYFQAENKKTEKVECFEVVKESREMKTPKVVVFYTTESNNKLATFNLENKTQ